ncbi:MAG TPA: DUF5808 domain-containing protein [Pseudonocardiaceae bacterium]|jgi:hypothetical protein|nr:DUF5808 domain-containing protein [Pseudonocardiaceae bacterium]
MAGRNKLGLAIGIGLVAAVVATELRKPPEEREWHGKLGGFVPYDLRPPTFTKVKDRVWDTDNPNLIVPQAFGIGWTVNVGRLYKLANPAG